MKLLSVKSVPVVSWSSDRALNFNPKFQTLALLCAGLLVFGIGESLMIAAGAGVSPWLVLSEGIANSLGWTIGVATFVISIVVLLLWIPLRQIPGLGTLLNALIIAAVLDFALPYLPTPEAYSLKLLQTVLGIILVGFGSGVYLIANLGTGPRDGLMTGLQRKSNLPIAWVRTVIEITVVVLGWSLGGTLGVGTLLFAFGIGWSVSIGLYTVETCSRVLSTPANSHE